MKRNMKIFIAVLFTIFISGSAFAQLTIKRQQQLAASNEAVSKFVKDNSFDYALITWNTSNWLRIDHSFACIIKQKDKWFLAKITSVDIPPRNQKLKNVVIKYKKLSETERDSVMRILKIKAAFATSQANFDKVSVQDSYIDYSAGIENGKEIFFDRCKDCNVHYLFEYTKRYSQARQYYAAEFLMESKCPDDSDFRAVKAFFNSYSNLEKLLNNMLE